MSSQAMPAAPKLACWSTLLGGRAIKSRVTKGAVRAAVPRVLRKDRRLKEELDVIVAESAGIGH
jgi:hypothetical protein